MVAAADTHEKVRMAMCVDVVYSPSQSSANLLVRLVVNTTNVSDGKATNVAYLFPPKHSLKLAYSLVIAAVRACLRI